MINKNLYIMKEEDYISDYYDNYYLHCPECMYQSLFGINYKQNIPFIQYRCRNNEHKGEIPLSEFYRKIYNNSIYKLICQYCEQLNKDMNYCFECEKAFCSDEKCLEKHKLNNHNKFIEIEKFDVSCLEHSEIKTQIVYCEQCKLNLCENCSTISTIHIKHNPVKIQQIDEETINEIENTIKEIEKERNSIIKRLEYYFKEKLNVFKKKSQLEIKLIKDVLYSYKLKKENSLNYEIIHNLKHLKFKQLNFKFPKYEINYNLLENFKLDLNKIEVEDDGINYR